MAEIYKIKSDLNNLIITKEEALHKLEKMEEQIHFFFGNKMTPEKILTI